MITKFYKYSGKAWYKVFKKFDLPKGGTVIEIAPGAADKVGKELKDYGFCGELYVIEPVDVLLSEVILKYKKELKGCKVFGVGKLISEVADFLPKKVDAIIANHPLDDMILGKSLNSKEFIDYFQVTYSHNPKKTNELWERIKNKDEIEDELAKEWAVFIQKTQPNLIAIAQYESSFFKENDVNLPDKYAFELLKKIEVVCKKKYTVERIDEIEDIKNPERWLFLKRKV